MLGFQKDFFYISSNYSLNDTLSDYIWVCIPHGDVPRGLFSEVGARLRYFHALSDL